MDYIGDNLRDFLTANGHVALKRVGNDYVLRSFTEKEIEQITFGYSIFLGKGAFGEVYKGMLDGKHPVAVKRYKNGIEKQEFAREVIVHSQINHKNVVRLMGCCTEENALMIIMEFICNGNLENLLHSSKANGHIPVPLDKRLDIAIVTAEVLAHMHSMRIPVLHGDIKPGNILLDENLEPKISDFGIARLLSADDEVQHTRYIIGCRGYVDPIYCQSGILTPKSDVYSFGVVLLEIITRKKSIGGNSSLVQMFIEALRGKKVRQLFDEQIVDARNIKYLTEIAKLAAKCLNLDVTVRPEMLEVADCLRTVRKAIHRAQGNISQGFLSRWTRSPAPNKSIPEKKPQPATPDFGDMRVFTQEEMKKKPQPATPDFGDMRVFTREEMKEITRNYSMIFRKEFNEKIYCGVVDNDVPVIVKDLAVCSETERECFIRTMTILCQKRHRNVANVIGFHFEENTCQTVYESSDLSLRNNESKWLTNRNLYEIICSRQKLPLGVRLSIAVHCAEGLVHIHSLFSEDPDSNGSDLLGNFRSANIFLDKNFMPKVFNNNLSTFLGVSIVQMQQYISADRFYDHGSKIDYSDPSDVAGLQFNPKSDIYSFGVVLLELISWKPAKYVSGGKTHVLAWDFLEAYRTSSNPLDILEEVYNEQDRFYVQEVITTAVECLQLDLQKRPELNDILSRLQIIEQAQSYTSKLTGRATESIIAV